MLVARVVFLIFNLIVLIESKRFDTRCKLARELLRAGLANDYLFGQWVCLAEKVSNRDTSVLTVKGGKKYYGLYQIPSQWCKTGKPGGDCNVRCKALLDDDIRDDTACAVTIFHREGFKYWKLWETRCKNDNLITSEIYKCPDLASPRSSPDRISTSEILRYRRMLMLKGFTHPSPPAPKPPVLPAAPEQLSWWSLRALRKWG